MNGRTLATHMHDRHEAGLPTDPRTRDVLAQLTAPPPGNPTMTPAEAAKATHGPKRSKYGNRKTVVDGITFDSRREADYYAKLKLEQRVTPGMWWLRQVPFHLPGGVTWRADFVVFRSAMMGPAQPYTVEVVDVKGFKIPMYRLKRKMVEALYPVKIVEA